MLTLSSRRHLLYERQSCWVTSDDEETAAMAVVKWATTSAEPEIQPDVDKGGSSNEIQSRTKRRAQVLDWVHLMVRQRHDDARWSLT